jgi:hypothetical protein
VFNVEEVNLQLGNCPLFSWLERLATSDIFT